MVEKHTKTAKSAAKKAEKATKTAERLVEAYMVRIETTSTFNDVAAN